MVMGALTLVLAMAPHTDAADNEEDPSEDAAHNQARVVWWGLIVVHLGEAQEHGLVPFGRGSGALCEESSRLVHCDCEREGRRAGIEACCHEIIACPFASGSVLAPNLTVNLGAAITVVILAGCTLAAAVSS